MQYYSNVSRLISSCFTLRTELRDTLLPSVLWPWMFSRTFFRTSRNFPFCMNTQIQELIVSWTTSSDHTRKIWTLLTHHWQWGANLSESLVRLTCCLLLYSWWFVSMTRCFYWLYQKSSALNLNNRWSHVLLHLRKAIPTIWKLLKKKNKTKGSQNSGSENSCISSCNRGTWEMKT